MDETDIRHLKTLERRLLWLACWMVHNPNHLRPKDEGDVKVGGHQASSASIVSIMTALYFHALRPQDRVAVKPHASPVFHAIQYLMGNQSLSNLKAFRGFGGAQSYPSRTKDACDVDFSTGSVGLGVAITSFASLVQDYVRAHGWGGDRSEGRMVALVGDAELDEGNVYECLQEGWKNDLRNVWWIVDYNRQSLDGVVHEGLWQRIEAAFSAFGWSVVRLKHGALQRAAFAEPGGDALRRWIDACPNDTYSALTYKGGAAWRARLEDALGQDADVAALVARRSDAELAELMGNLGGHCVETLVRAFSEVQDNRPTLFLAYTIKGWGTPLAGHKDNRGGLMTKAQMETFRAAAGVPEGAEWDPMATVPDTAALRTFLDTAPFFAEGRRRHVAPALPTPGPVWLDDTVQSTQGGFGKILDALAKSKDPLAERILTMSPDVTVSTGLSPWVNRRGLFARDPRSDTFRVENIPSEPEVDLLAHRPAPGVGHRGDEPVPRAQRGGAEPFALRRAALAGGHGLRPFRSTGLRRTQLRLLPGRTVPDRRHAVGGDAGARGRRAPVGRHAADRDEPGRPPPPSSRPGSTSCR